MYYYLFVLQAGFTDGALGLESGSAQGRVADPGILVGSGFGFMKSLNPDPSFSEKSARDPFLLKKTPGFGSIGLNWVQVYFLYKEFVHNIF